MQTLAAVRSRYNNIDVLYGITLGGTTRDLAVVSDRGTDKLHIFAINGAVNSPLTEVTATGVPLVFGGQEGQVEDHLRPRRLAQPGPARRGVRDAGEHHQPGQGRAHRRGRRQGRLPEGGVAEPAGPPSRRRPTWKPCFNPKHPDWTAHAEGMVVDPATGTLWADQEIVGLWKMTTDLTTPQLLHKLTRFGQTYSTAAASARSTPARPATASPTCPATSRASGSTRPGRAPTATSVISNQQKSIFTVFSRDGGTYSGHFAIGDAPGATDKVDATDGLDVINVPLGPVVPAGPARHPGRQGRAGGRHELQVHAVADGGRRWVYGRPERRPAVIGAAAATPLGPTMRISHTGPLAHRVEQGTFNPKVQGSRPWRPTASTSRVRACDRPRQGACGSGWVADTNSDGSRRLAGAR